MTYTRPHHYTEEEIEWLKQNRPTHCATELAGMFNEKFHTNVKPSQLAAYCQRHHISADRAACQHVDHTGETGIMKCGLHAEVIACKGYKDIDVRFEDGTVVTHKSYQAFQNGEIHNPNTGITPKYAKKYIGKSAVMNDGRMLTITDYRGYSDVTGVFDDGTEVTFGMGNFDRGAVAHPDDISVAVQNNIQLKNKKRKYWIGQKAVMNNGMEAEIIQYDDANHITVRFTNGGIARANLGNFKKGTVRNPMSPSPTHPVIPGMVFTNTAGLRFQAVRQHENNKWLVRFEDGEEKDNVMTISITHKKVKHPAFNGTHYSSDDFHGYSLNKLAFRMNDDKVYYNVTTPEGKGDVTTLQDILKHQNIKCPF